MNLSNQNKKNGFVIAFIITANLLFAQEKELMYTSFLNDVYNTYYTAESYQMDVEVGMYDKNENLIYPIQKNQTIKSGNNFYIQTPELTSISTEEYQMWIDHFAKEIRYTAFRKEKDNKSIGNKNNIPNFSEIETSIESIEIGKEKTIIIFKETPVYKSTIYTLNTNSKLLEQIDYYAASNEYGQPEHIQIKYATSNFNKEVDTTLFQLNEYIIKVKEGEQPSETYKSYSLINNTINQ